MDKRTEKKEIDFLDFLRIAQKRKWIITSCVLIIVILAGVYTFTRTPLYRAKAKILLEDPRTTVMNVEELFNSSYVGEAYLTTQLKLLQSRTLAERVARRLKLGDRHEVRDTFRKKENLIQTIKGFVVRWIVPQKKEEQDELEVNVEEDRHSQYAPFVQRDLGIDQIEETKIVHIYFTSASPVLAADIVNTIVEEFKNFSVELRYEATRQAAEFLNEQQTQLKAELTAKENELQKYGADKKILIRDDEKATVIGKFESLNNAYMEAILVRIEKEGFYREMRNMDVDSIPQEVKNSLLTSLRSEYISLRNEYETKKKYLKPDHPEMRNLQAKLTTTRDALEIELEKAKEAALKEYQAALKKEKDLSAVLEEQRREVMQMNSNAIHYRSLKIEIENIQNLLNELSSRQNETLVSARLKGYMTSNIKVIDSALVPTTPFSPNKKRNMILALILGLFVGFGLAFLVDYLDNTVKGPEEVEKLVGLPSLGIIPALSSNNSKSKYRYTYYSQDCGDNKSEDSQHLEEIEDIELINYFFPKFHIGEDYRTVRTSILFSHAGDSPHTISFTSTFPQEGKTSTVINTAVSFAQLEKKVLLIDGDLRKPRLHKIFEARNRIGLSSCLIGISSVEEAIQETSVENVWLLPSGLHPPNPAELINSKKMESLVKTVGDKFDVVFIDSPPVLAVVDSVVIASMTEAVVYVIKEGKTSRKTLVKAVDELNRVQANILGVVFNGVKMKKQGYYSPYYKDYVGSYESYEQVNAPEYREYEDEDY
jgi:capsular exopolysaccharide synthesis family protein